MPAEARTVSVTISRSPADVYEYVRDERNLPAWSFIESVAEAADGWTAEVDGITVRVAFAERNAFGVLDHDVTAPSGEVVHVPFRVIPNGDGSELLFTTFRRDGVDFDDDVATVERDLANVKNILEG